MRAPRDKARGVDEAPSERAGRRRVGLGPRARRRLSIVLAIAGVLLIVEAAVTVLWEEPITSYLASLAQDGLRTQLQRLEHAPPRLGRAEQRSLAAIGGYEARVDVRLALLAADVGRRTRPGQALGSVSAPAIGIDFVFVQGTDAASLRKGPGHYLQTPLPGEQGTVGIAGHRTTYLAPFRDIDQLHRGDRIIVTMPYGRFTYSVEGHRIVRAGRTDAFRDVGHPQLVLSACHPLYSASHRILVTARLVARQPLGAGDSIETAGGAAGAAQAAQQLRALGTRVLALDDSGADVRELQYLLGVPSSGYFGYETESAVEDFERGQGMRPDGIADEAVKRLLAQRARPPLTPPTPPAVAPAPGAGAPAAPATSPRAATSPGTGGN